MTETPLQINRTVDRMTVRIEHLDKLLNLAGEVIITSSILHDLQREMVDAVTYHRPIVESSIQTIKAADEASRRISQDLHDLVMAIRMVEIGETFRLFRRSVRDLSRTLKKEIELKIEGENVQIDKALAERLVEPVLHLVRNAADHGIEQPLERSRLGKPPQGTIRLEAIEHENETEIIITDDGRGIDENAIREKAKLLGLLGPGDSFDLTNVLCISGFTTKEQATDTSGRGVGLDIVRNMVTGFDGKIEILSTPQVGTTFRMMIPKLRAVNIIDALIVRCSHNLFSLAIDKVISLQGIPVRQIQATMDRERFIRYLGEPIALFDLQELLGGGTSESLRADTVPVVVIEGKKERIAVIVTEFLSPQKLVNVPLETGMFGDAAPGVAGTCIISGGQVGLTVDIDRIVEVATGHGDSPDLQDSSERSTFDLNSTPTNDDVAPQKTHALSTVTHNAQDELLNKQKYQKRFMDTDERTNDSSSYELSDKDTIDLLDEVRRSLAELQDLLLTLEDETGNPKVMRDVFRRLHALKGSFAMLENNPTADLAHNLETLLDLVRKDMLVMDRNLMDLMLDGVSELADAAQGMPAKVPQENLELKQRIHAVIDDHRKNLMISDESALLNEPFQLPTIVELQLLGALKNHSQTYETFLRFHPGRQANYLVIYLTLRRLCYFGTILATIPSIDQIEQGVIGNAVKLLWATAIQESELAQIFEELAPLYNISEFHSMATTVFRYESSGKFGDL
ncbi:MAG: ATP-binding protein [Planctomycetaceae bacterium]|nr:ATP-binding protein [Planctomycetaceae bacterium]